MSTQPYKSLLHEMTCTTDTVLWNDSCSIAELSYAIEHGAVGATANPVIIGTVLLQEMHREVNTMGSKTNMMSITQLVIAMKDEVESLREQIQNLE